MKLDGAAPSTDGPHSPLESGGGTLLPRLGSLGCLGAVEGGSIVLPDWPAAKSGVGATLRPIAIAGRAGSGGGGGRSADIDSVREGRKPGKLGGGRTVLSPRSLLMRGTFTGGELVRLAPSIAASGATLSCVLAAMLVRRPCGSGGNEGGASVTCARRCVSVSETSFVGVSLRTRARSACSHSASGSKRKCSLTRRERARQSDAKAGAFVYMGRVRLCATHESG